MKTQTLAIGILALSLLAGLGFAGLTITQGTAGVLVYNGTVSGGTPPYFYQVFMQPPGGTYNAVAGATNTMYVFNTTTSTQLGVWNAILQVTDSNSPMDVVNSVAVGVNVIALSSSSTSSTSTTSTSTSSTSTTSATTTVVSGGGGYQSTTSKSTTSLTTTTVPPTTAVGVLESAWQIAGNTWTAFTAWIKPVYAMTFIQIPDWILAAVALMVVTIVVRNEKKDSRAYWVPALALIVVVALYFIA